MKNIKQLHPMQDLVKDEHNTIRFRENKIVKWMLDFSRSGGTFNLHSIASMDFSDEDQMQFAQLIGYSVSGYGDLSYVSNISYNKADKKSLKLAAGEPNMKTNITMEITEEEKQMILNSRIKSFKPRQLDSYTPEEKCKKFDEFYNKAADLFSEILENCSYDEDEEHFMFETTMELLSPKDEDPQQSFWLYYNELLR